MENGVDIKEQSRMLATLTSSKVFMVVLDILDLGRKYLYFGICFHIITNHSLEMNHHSKSDFKPITNLEEWNRLPLCLTSDFYVTAIF